MTLQHCPGVRKTNGVCRLKVLGGRLTFRFIRLTATLNPSPKHLVYLQRETLLSLVIALTSNYSHVQYGLYSPSPSGLRPWLQYFICHKALTGFHAIPIAYASWQNHNIITMDLVPGVHALHTIPCNWYDIVCHLLVKLMTMFESSPEGTFGFEGRTLVLGGCWSILLTPPLSWVRTTASTGAVARTGDFWEEREVLPGVMLLWIGATLPVVETTLLLLFVFPGGGFDRRDRNRSAMELHAFLILDFSRRRGLVGGLGDLGFFLRKRTVRIRENSCTGI